MARSAVHTSWRRSTPDELQSIVDSSIQALRLDYRTISRKDEWGNLFHYASRFIHREGRPGHYYDVFLGVSAD